MAASVVLLPEPVGPVIRTSPLGYAVKDLDDLGQVEFVNRLDIKRHPSEDPGHRSPLRVNVAAKTGDAWDAVSHIYGLAFLETCALPGTEDLAEHPLHVLRLQRIRLDRNEPTLNPQ